MQSWRLGERTVEWAGPAAIESNRGTKMIWSLLLMTLGTTFGGDANVQAVDRPGRADLTEYYVFNRPPLQPSALAKLPIGAIRPEGWLRHQLELQKDGMMGHLGEISPFLAKEGNAWLSADGSGDHGWEEVPYWLKGYLNTALVLDDAAMLDEARIWIEGALASQKEDGWFGPDKGRGGKATRLEGRDDLWPNMIMLFCLQDWYDATGDERVIELMKRYFRYLSEVPDEQYLLGYWPKMRGGDQLWSIYWLYNRTGEEWLLELAAKNHRNTARWDEGLPNWHNVNIAQCFGEGATWWMQSGERSDLESANRNWLEVRRLYGRVPGGMFGSDENCRPGCDDPRQAIETCGIVEEMLSDEILVAITGDPLWADRCEDAAYNSLPAALTEDLRALRYLTAPNQPISDAEEHSPGIQNGGAMLYYSPHIHRCCQHNHGHGWPYFAEHLWYATPDDGLAAVFYGESTVTAKVGAKGNRVEIRQRTPYPFGDVVELAIRPEKTMSFPLYLRVPGWCREPSLTISGKAVPVKVDPGQYLRIERTWQLGDHVTLVLPMPLGLRRWPGNHGSVSVDCGPLTYSLRIEERRERSEDTTWAAWEYLPASPWNYALKLGEDGLPEDLEFDTRPLPTGSSPWTLETVPFAMQVTARKVPQWKLDRFGLCAELQDSPVKTDGPDERITLIPMGAARLRISSFPVVGEGVDAHEWHEPVVPKLAYRATASHTWGGDSAEAIADGIAPSSSGDQSITRHTFWPHKGTAEWLQEEFDEPKRCEVSRVFWFDDTGAGECRLPESWRLLWLDGERWKPVVLKGAGEAYGVSADGWDEVLFEPVTAKAFRLEVKLREGFSGGVLEWALE